MRCCSAVRYTQGETLHRVPPFHRLSEGGPDHPRWDVGVCPNRHKRAHYSSDAKEYNRQLDAIVKDLEDELGREHLPTFRRPHHRN